MKLPTGGLSSPEEEAALTDAQRTMAITYETEGAFLNALVAMYEGPWWCSECNGEITENTGWKPVVSVHYGEPVGGPPVPDGALIQILCGPCMVIEQSKNAD